ncbi:MAG: ABC transporter permease [Nitrospirota bacterium]|nr:ABC transporter permease [Nitrospirota bacterium]
MKNVLHNISWRAWRVWQRNYDVYRATWKVNFIPPLLEPLLFLFAFGFGLGQMVKSVDYGGMEVSYLRFIAPGLIAVAVMNHSFFETTYASFVRMYYQKTFDAILSTPLTVEDIILGEMLWAATKSLFAGTIMMGVITAFGLLDYPHSLLIIPLTMVAGFTFAGIGMCFTAIVKGIEMFNFPVFLFITPMFLFSSVFFPLSVLPGWAQTVAKCLPLTQLVTIVRDLAFGRVTPDIFLNLLWLVLLGAVCSTAGIVMMKKRLLK